MKYVKKSGDVFFEKTKNFKYGCIDLDYIADKFKFSRKDMEKIVSKINNDISDYYIWKTIFEDEKEE